jgi:type VI secretion system secreted protein Hcp
MAFDAFLQIDGIPGECTDDGHKNWIELNSFAHSMEQPASSSGSNAGGATAERVNIDPFTIVHPVDKASPKFYEACCTGKVLPTAIIQLHRAGGSKMMYAQISMKNVVITSVQYGGASGDDFPSETVVLTASSYVWQYNQQDKTSGSSLGSVSTGWDLAANKTTM